MCPVAIVPGTDKTYFKNPHCGDRIIDLKNYPDLDTTLSQEDVTVIGNWEDYSGSGTKPAQAVVLQGISTGVKSTAENLAGNETEINVTERGKNASTQRQRIKIIYVDN